MYHNKKCFQNTVAFYVSTLMDGWTVGLSYLKLISVKYFRLHLYAQKYMSKEEYLFALNINSLAAPAIVT